MRNKKHIEKLLRCLVQSHTIPFIINIRDKVHVVLVGFACNSSSATDIWCNYEWASQSIWENGMQNAMHSEGEGSGWVLPSLTCGSPWRSRCYSPHPLWMAHHPDPLCRPHSGNSRDGRTCPVPARSANVQRHEAKVIKDNTVCVCVCVCVPTCSCAWCDWECLKTMTTHAFEALGQYQTFPWSSD